MKKVLPIVLFVAIGLGVFTAYKSPESKINRIGEEKLISDAGITLEQFRADGERYGVIPREFWAEGVKSIDPDAVMTYQRGILLVTDKSKRRMSGVYVIFESPEISPRSGSGDSFRKIDDRIYFAVAKIRQPIWIEQVDGIKSVTSLRDSTP